MKKLSLIIFVLIFCQITTSAQPCLPLGITFSTQAQIDNFQTNNPNCTEIEGGVLIEGNDITNLNGLNVLTSIGGSLQINNNPALTSLTGLDNVTAIGGSLIFDFNYALTSLTGLDNVTSIGGGLGIGNSASLTSLTGLDNVTAIGGDLYIDDNAALASLTGLENVTSIGGLLYIDFNSALTSFTGLDNLASIGGGLVIFENISLTSLTGIDNIDAGTISDLSIEYNSLLSTCEVQSVCDYLVNPSGTISIHDNATGCNSQQEVEAACEAIFVENLTNNESFAIYPNPAADKITIETVGDGHLFILNLGGKEIITRQFTEPLTQIDISTISAGVYFVRLTNDRTVAVEKFVKR